MTTKIFNRIILLLALCLVAGPVFAWQVYVPPVSPDVFNSANANSGLFQRYKNSIAVPVQNLMVPTVLQADFSVSEIEQDSFAVYDQSSSRFLPYLFIDGGSQSNVPSAMDMKTWSNISTLVDGNSQTRSEFTLYDPNSKNIAAVELIFPTAINSNALTIILDAYVTLPDFISIKADVNGKEVLMVNKIPVSSSVINFPETLSTRWIVEFEYSQPLRIAEIKFNNLLNTQTKKSVRFLAEPSHVYMIYANPEVATPNYALGMEAPNLTNGDGVKNVGLLSLQINNSFVPADSDKDQVPDMYDNCVSIQNTDQTDVDSNGKGDVCDDFDRDGVIGQSDNCLNIPNYNQKDTDGDSVGDACDPDESRLTEKYPWIVWIALGFAVLVFLCLFFIATRKMRDNAVVDPS